MGTILQNINLGQRIKNSSKIAENELIAIVKEDPQEVLNVLFEKYRLGKYNSINTPFQIYSIDKTPHLSISPAANSAQNVSSIYSIGEHLTIFKDNCTYFSNQLVLFTRRMIVENLSKELSPNSKNKYRSLVKNYLFYREKSSTDSLLENKLKDILELSKITLNIGDIETLQTIYERRWNYYDRELNYLNRIH